MINKENSASCKWGDNCGSWIFVDNDNLSVKMESIGENNGILINPKTEHYISNESKTILDFLVISQPTTNDDRITIEK